MTTTATGVLAFATGDPGSARWTTGVHGVSGLGLLVLVPAKSRIARRGLRRPGRSRKVIGWMFVVLVGLAVGSGVLHALWGWDPVVLGLLPMQIHVGAAVGVVVLLVAHLRVHRRRPLLRRTDLDRRRALLGTGVVAGSALLWFVAPGRDRRETGSHEVTTVPVTQWMFDPVPRLPDRPLRTPGGEVDLAALPSTSVRAVLDCTGGWYSEQQWRGVSVSALGLPASASIDVVSATGYRRRFPASEAGSLLLATHLAGRLLSAGHGAPVRLVAPGRRGFWWVKWVVAVEVVDEPSWWQPPFPLQ
ncbi:molybdopterin-dependent oxidoreductase [Pseudonocardia abyssalis]|uniref:Molybdopterin-dependent oxidoreductase n=1 Tax=Pseudonocardia abyssalis TaxID=2792008 RepID=A0ABS6V135_9PSEU|nr:molybdopterin-dependent oxidoreductase [Pseudonocardia abyssalis]MBW0117328.1 molybdopterin-dependent oxidoreductase [Pseudonocardia abyssalis]MBW0138211.1 molybdopterin-dependent oxidoreductase [Pseudonocardia abyssalis]